MNEEMMEEIISSFSENGLSIRLTNGTYSVFKDYEMGEGELIWLRDQEILVLGEEGKILPHSKHYIPLDSATDASLSLDQRISSFWKRLSNNTIEGELIKIIMPKAHASFFTTLMPKNFMFLEGGEIPDTSLFHGYEWSNAPDGRGCFSRSTIDENSVGKVEEEKLGFHSHHLQRSFSNGNVTYPPKHKYFPRPNNKKDRRDILMSVSIGNLSVDSVGSENRPKNICIMSVWKVAEFVL